MHFKAVILDRNLATEKLIGFPTTNHTPTQCIFNQVYLIMSQNIHYPNIGPLIG